MESKDFYLLCKICHPACLITTYQALFRGFSLELFCLFHLCCNLVQFTDGFHKEVNDPIEYSYLSISPLSVWNWIEIISIKSYAQIRYWFWNLIEAITIVNKNSTRSSNIICLHSIVLLSKSSLVMALLSSGEQICWNHTWYLSRTPRTLSVENFLVMWRNSRCGDILDVEKF